jgi:hypothetical protein
VHHFVRWVSRNVGADVLVRAAKTIPAPRRGGLRPTEMFLGVIASRWYPADAVHALLDALLADEDCPAADALVSEAIGEVMDGTLGGVYRVLFSWMASPSRYAKYAPKLWGSYYADGVMQVTETSDHSSATTISEWEGHHALLCAAHVEAARSIYDRMGCRDVRVRRVSCVSDGAPHCEFAVQWSD